MFQHQFIREFLNRYRKQILLSIFLFWLIFAVFMIVEDELSMRMAHQSTDPVDRLQYFIRFVLWFLLTPLIVYLAVTFPIRKRFLVSDIIKHFFLGILVIALEFTIEIPLIRMATLSIKHSVPPVKDYAAMFILKLNFYLLLYFFVVGTTYILLYMEGQHRIHLIAKEAEIKNQLLQTQLAETKLHLLHMKLQPHFLFNTHHAIISLMLNDEKEKAIKMLTRLSDLLRAVLEVTQQSIPLEQELAYLRWYLDIQQIRFPDRLQVQYDIDPGLMEVRVPVLLLQPLVENAVKYGVSANKDAGAVIIKVCREQDNMVLQIVNDGEIPDPEDYREGIGISNTRERLMEMYNGMATFSLEPVAKHYVAAIIKIPVTL